jgi:hypothetical protein
VYRRASDEVSEIYAARGCPAHLTEEGLSRFPCKLARPSRVKMLNLLRYLTFGLRRCVVVMETARSCRFNE